MSTVHDIQQKKGSESLWSYRQIENKVLIKKINDWTVLLNFCLLFHKQTTQSSNSLQFRKDITIPRADNHLCSI